jgi:hypothetical protein
MTKLCKNVHFLLKIATMCKIFKKWYADKIWVKMVGGPNFGKMVGGTKVERGVKI